MMRTIERNSSEDNMKVEMKKMMEDFVRSGYNMEELKKIETKAHEMFHTDRNTEEKDTLTFPIFFFDEINAFKKIIYEFKNDLVQAVGDTKIIMAVKRNPSIGNTVVQNKQISMLSQIKPDQRCQGPGCLQCPLVNTNNNVNVNNMQVKPSKTLNCKSRNVIYLWQCQVCDHENSFLEEQSRKHP